MTEKDYDNYQCGPEQDYFTPDPGLVKGPVKCGVCSEQMLEKRNVMGPRGFVMAMSGSKELHDTFWCPHREEAWHIQARKLRGLARGTPSGRLAKMFMDEANDIITTRTSTKEDGLWRVL